MATSPETAAFVLEQAMVSGALGAQDVSVRKMFGEYALYCDAKVVGLICDDTLFVKPTEGARALLPDAQMGEPYPKAKPQIIADGLLDEPELLAEVLQAIAKDLPAPKPKAKRKPKARKDRST